MISFLNPFLRRIILLGGALLASQAWAQSNDLPELTAKELGQGYRDGYVLAKPRASHRATVDQEEAQAGERLWRRFERFGQTRVIRLRAGETTAAGIARLQATGRYEFVEPDFIRHSAASPNDPDFSQQWGLSNTGSNPDIPGPGIPGADIHAVAAWNAGYTDASKVVVAVVDSGARLTHADLVSNFWQNPTENKDGYVNDLYGINATVAASNATSGSPTDNDGHGTHVSGIIGAIGNNGTDVSGVAWKAQLMELKFIGSNGSGSTAAEITCLDFALAHGAAIINASFGSSQPSQAEYTALQSLQAAGIIVVVAAGNDGEDNGLSPFYPASYLLDNLVTVGCSDNRDDAVFFTASGSGIVDLFAPGYNIVSLYNTNDTATATLSGTSMSTPFVTGSLALLKANYPGDTYRQLINRLLRSVDFNSNLVGRAQTSGRLNLATALTSAAGANTPFNDGYATRGHLTGPLLTVRSSNAGAAGALWWDWTAPVSGPVNLTTTGSAFPTILAAYTGSNLAGLTPIAISSVPGNGASALNFNVQAGSTYVITLAGQNGASGLTLLNLAYANDAFAGASSLAGPSAGLMASNINATREAGEPRILNNAGGHSLWYYWTAPSAGQYQVSVFSPDFDPLLAVYTGSAVSSLTLVAAAAGSAINPSAGTPASLCTCTFTAAAGATYALTVDGNVDAGAANEQFVFPTTTPIGAGQFTLTVADSAWQTATGDSLTCSPALGSDGTLYVGGTNAVFYAFNPDGSTKWTATAGGSFDTASAALSLDGSTVYAGAADGNLYAFNTVTGAVLWKFALATSPVASSPAVAADGTIYVKDSGTNFYALTPGGGQKWVAIVPGISYASPSIAADGTVYIGSDSGTLFAFTPAGALKWTFTASASIYTAPAIDASGRLYFGTLGGTFYAVSASGNQLWSYQAGNSISSSPALSASGGTVYFGSYDHNLYALATATGAVQWTYATGGEIRASSPAVDANGVIYVGSYDRNLYAINTDGTLKRVYATGDWVRSSPLISQTSLYFGSNDHRLYSFALGAGPAASAWPTYMGGPQRAGRPVVPGPAITAPPLGASASAGGGANFGVTASGAVAYQWYFNGVAIAGATGSTLTLANVGTNQAGNYTVATTNAAGGVTVSTAATLAVTASARLVNLSVLSNIQGSLAMGFVVGGTGTSGAENLLIRAIGPSIGPGSAFNVPGVLPDPKLTVVQQSTGAQVASDAGWGTPSSNIAVVTAADSATGAFALANTASLDSALVASLASVTGGYSATVAGSAGDNGFALTEVYDDNANYVATNPRLVNLSCLTHLAAGATLDAGFVVRGSTSETLLVRVTGPALAGAPYNVTGTMPDPQIAVQPLSPSAYPTAPTATNAGWAGNPQITAADTLVGAFALSNSASLDSALLITVPPNVPYVVQASSVSGTAGTVLVEIYEVP